MRLILKGAVLLPLIVIATVVASAETPHVKTLARFSMDSTQSSDGRAIVPVEDAPAIRSLYLMGDNMSIRESSGANGQALIFDGKDDWARIGAVWDSYPSVVVRARAWLDPDAEKSKGHLLMLVGGKARDRVFRISWQWLEGIQRWGLTFHAWNQTNASGRGTPEHAVTVTASPGEWDDITAIFDAKAGTMTLTTNSQTKTIDVSSNRLRPAPDRRHIDIGSHDAGGGLWMFRGMIDELTVGLPEEKPSPGQFRLK